MKKTIKITTVTIAIFFLFIGCCKDEQATQSYFYVNQTASQTAYKLYINDEYRGELPFINIGSTCENNYIKQHALKILVTEKNYKVEARDCSGTILASGTINLRAHANHLSNSEGVIVMSRSTDAVIVDFGTRTEVQQ